MIELINPSAYSRTEVVNITVNSQHVKFIPSKDNKISKAQILTKFEFDEYTGYISEFSKEFYLYFEVTLLPFSFTRIAYTEIQFEIDCNKEWVELSSLKSTTSLNEMTISNEHYKIELEQNELISRIYSKSTKSYFNIPTGVFSYSGRKWETFSGLYIFSPAAEGFNHELKIVNCYIQEGLLLSVIETMYSILGTKTYLIHQIIIYKSSDEIINQAVRSSYSIRSYDVKEFAIRTKVSEFRNKFTEIFMDNSMVSISRFILYRGL